MDNTPPNKLENDGQYKPPDNIPETVKQSPLSRLLNLGDRYLLIFIILIIAFGGFIFWNLSKNHNKNQASKATSLTDQQIAALKGSTTLVGDSQQTLDVQSNSVFEGQVVMRSNLDVAGTIKVGGGLSLASVTVGGSSTFGDTSVNGNFAVIGTSTFQGPVSLQKNISVAGSGSFGSLSTSQLNVATLQLTGDLTLSHHVVATGAAPSRSNGAALGSGGTSSVAGSDTAGTVTINTGSGPGVGCFVTVNFSQHYASTPRVIISPSNSSAGSIDYYTNRSASGFSICDSSAPSAATTYIFDYFIAG